MAPLVEQIANAVLYEGYILYPYRPSSVKNRQRWTFGGLYPRDDSVSRSSGDVWSLQTECLIVGGECPTTDLRIRFLHLVERSILELTGLPSLEAIDRHTDPAAPESGYRPTESLAVSGRVLRPWQEAVERDVMVPGLDLDDLIIQPRHVEFAFPASCDYELVRNSDSEVVGMILRSQNALSGEVSITAEEECGPGGERLFRVRTRISNLTPVTAAARIGRDGASASAFVATHAIFEVRGGAFVSLIDPPAMYRESAGRCANIGVWPVLVGDEDARDTLLASPIILYDYPQIAPESPGDLFDGTEIDEILTLRILAMTDAEKREVRETDARASALLDRTEALTWDQIGKLHGALRSPRAVESSRP